MSLLDFLLVAVALASVVYVNSPLASDRNTRILTGILVGAWALQMAMEGFRSYLSFIYLTYGLLLALFAVMGFSGFFGKYRLTRRFMIAVMVLCMLPAVVQMLLFPVASLPFEKGAYLVGTKSFLIMNKGGGESTEDSSHQGNGRTMNLRLFYPADRSNLKKAPWLEHGKVIAKKTASYYRFPGFFAANLDLVQSNSYYDAALADLRGEIPVILISHKVGSHSDFYVSLAERLATRGYVVALINHTQASLAAFTDQGEVIGLNRKLLEDGYASDVYDLYNRDLNDAVKFIGKLNDGKYLKFLKGRLRMENMMLVGHGVGGRSMSQPSKSILNMGCQVILDPYIESRTVNPYEVYKLPTMLISSDEGYQKESESALTQYLRAAESEVSYYHLVGSKSSDLNGLSQSNPVLRVMGLKGNLMIQDRVDLWQSLIGDYADIHLKSKQLHDSPLSTKNKDAGLKLIYKSP